MRSEVDVDLPSHTPARRGPALLGLPARAVPAVVALAVAIALLALIALFTIGSGSGSDDDSATGSGSSGGTTPAAQESEVSSQVLAWMQLSLPRGATLLTDAPTAPDVTDRGWRDVTPNSAGGSRFGFVVETPALRAAAAQHPAVAAALRGSVPVAMFVDPTNVTIRQVSDLDADDLAAEVDKRRDADQQLLDNPAVRTDSAAARALTAGNLDLRPAGVIALLAATTRVEVVRIDTVAAEQAADRPARTVVLRGAAPSTLRKQLAALSGAYRASQVQPAGDGALRVTWPVDVTPVSAPN